MAFATKTNMNDNLDCRFTFNEENCGSDSISGDVTFSLPVPHRHEMVTDPLTLRIVPLHNLTIIAAEACQSGAFHLSSPDGVVSLLFRATESCTVELDGREAASLSPHQASLARATEHLKVRFAPGSLTFLVVPQAALAQLGVAIPAPSLSLEPDCALEILAGQARCLVDWEPPAALALACESSLLGLLAFSTSTRVLRPTDRGDNQKAPPFQDVVRSIATHFRDHEFGAVQLARQYNINLRTLQKLLQQHGTTFSELLTRHRLKMAEAFLTDPAQAERKISDIAFECGFNDISTFNRVFRREFGKPPSSIRRGGDQLAADTEM